jgi:hypothetical protein
MWNQSNREVWNAPCVEGAQAHQYNLGLLDIPETIVACHPALLEKHGSVLFITQERQTTSCSHI